MADLKLPRAAPSAASRRAKSVPSVAFSPDSKRLAVWDAESGSQMVRLLDTATGAEQESLKVHEASVHSVAFRPDATRLFAAGSANQGEESKAMVKEWGLPSDERPDLGPRLRPWRS